MPIDQAKLGQHISEMMDEIEKDPNVPDDAEINTIITIVEIAGRDGDNEWRAIRTRSNQNPLPTVGYLEEAKAIQILGLAGGQAG